MLIIGGFTAAIFGAGNLTAHAIRHDALGHGKWAKYFFSGALAGFAVGSIGYLGYSGAVALSGIKGLLGGVGKFSLTVGKISTGLQTASFATSIIGGAINNGWTGIANAGKLILGNFYLDENKSFFCQVWEGISRHTWEAPQQGAGYFWSGIRNCWADRVDFWGGATYFTNFCGEIQGVTMGSFINMDNSHEDKMNSSLTFDDYMLSKDYAATDFYVHEYGHTIQSKKWGYAYMPIPALLSFWNCRDFWDKNKTKNDYFWTEVAANTYMKKYMGKHHPTYNLSDTLITKY